MSYVGQIKINGAQTPSLVGSTLYGICTSDANAAAKVLYTTDDPSTKFINTLMDTAIQGTTIHIKFTKGNDVTSNATLTIGSNTKNIIGLMPCQANTVISFTYDENQVWIANDNIGREYEFEGIYNASTNKAMTESAVDGKITALNLAAASQKGIITDLGNNLSSTDLPTASAVAAYIQSQTGGLAGITGAMHFRGISSTALTDGGTENPTVENETITELLAGDVYLYDALEFVWVGDHWELLGDEGSYALKSSVDTVVKSVSLSSGTPPSIDIAPVTIPKVTTAGRAPVITKSNVSIPNVTNAGSDTTMSVTGGVLNITLGSKPTLGDPIDATYISAWTDGTDTVLDSTPITVGSASNFSSGAFPTLSSTPRQVVVPIAQQSQEQEP